MKNERANESAKSAEEPAEVLSAMEDVVRNDRRGACPTAAVVSRRRGESSSRRFLWIYLGLVGSLLLRASVLDFESGDYMAFLSNWYDYFVEHGRWAALKDNFTGYPVAYLEMLSLSSLLPLPKLYAIKLLSIVCDYAAAWFTFKLVRHVSGSRQLAVAAGSLLLFLPTVWFNSAVWGQCDVMHAGALLAALYYVIVKRPAAAMVAFGLSCALKPQAILLVPFLGGMFFRERWPWKWIAIPPVVYALCGLPAMAAGRPVVDVLFRWARHTNYPELTLGATNWYQWVSNEYYEVFFMPGIVLAITATVMLILSMQRPTSRERGPWLVTSALLSVLLVPYFLPGMHERYFYAADLLSFIYAFVVPWGWIVAVMVEFCSFFTYLPFLFNKEPVPRPLLALVMTGAIAVVAVDYAKGIVKGPAREG